MAEQIYTKALTTLTRVKGRLTITESGHDTVLNRLINACTDYVESYCDRKFIETIYTNEEYSNDSNGSRLFLRHYPVTDLDKLEYRAGTPDVPSWTEYLASEYMLEEGGRTGTVHLLGRLPVGPNVLRTTYTAGYAVDWANAGASTHELPADLSDLCERLVVRIFKRRESEGKEQESTGDAASVNWSKDLNVMDKETLNKYKRMIFV